MMTEHPLDYSDALTPEQTALKRRLRDLASLLQTAQNQEGQERSRDWNQKMDKLHNEISRAILSIQPHQSYQGRSVEELEGDSHDLLLPLS